jgi:predicted DNA repair protein MutK
MLGGTYLCYEGAEKVWEAIHPAPRQARDAGQRAGAGHEDTLVRQAIRTDFILSAEIMVISLNEVADQPVLQRA